MLKLAKNFAPSLLLLLLFVSFDTFSFTFVCSRSFLFFSWAYCLSHIMPMPAFTSLLCLHALGLTTYQLNSNVYIDIHTHKHTLKTTLCSVFISFYFFCRLFLVSI